MARSRQMRGLDRSIACWIGVVGLMIGLGLSVSAAQLQVPTLVQSASQNNGSLDKPTCTATFAADNTAGNLILVAVTVGASSAAEQPSLADTQGNLYYPVSGQIDWDSVGGKGSSQLFYAPNIKSGPNTVTMTEVGGYNGVGNAFNQLAVFEYSGLTLASPLDVAAAAYGQTTTNSLAVSSGSATTTTNGELVFGYGTTYSGILSSGPGFKTRPTPFNLAEDLVQAAAGPIAATATDSAANDLYVMFMAALRPAQAGQTGPVLPAPGTWYGVATVPLLITNTAAEVNTNLTATQTIIFNYTNRDALLADGWSFIATNSSGPRNTEITNSASGGVISYDQNAHPGALRIPCDVGDLLGADNNTRNTLLHTLSSNWMSLRLLLTFAPTTNYQQANLVLYQDDDNYLQTGIAWNTTLLTDRGVIVVAETNAFANFSRIDLHWLSLGAIVTNLYLRLDRDLTTGNVSSFCSLDGTDWQFIKTYSQGLVNPQVGIWVGGATVPYSASSPNCDVQELDIITRNAGPVLTYRLLSPPTGVTIDTNGVIHWTPTKSQSPSTNTLRAVVTDNQVPPLSATNRIRVVVSNLTNTVPVLPVQPNQVVNELALLVVTNTATDHDIPAQTLTYILVNAPAGAAIDTNGVITWTPSLGQGTNTYTLTTVVTDSGSPPLSATNSFQVAVNAVNLPPVLPAQSDQTIVGLTPLLVVNTATEADSRGLPLTYQLVSGPTNAVIDTNGVISWTPVVAQVPSTNVFTTVVSDNDPWAVNGAQLSATNSFVVVVLAQPLGNGPRLPVQTSQTVSELATLVVTNTASYVGLAPEWVTNTILFTYSNRDALLADGWSFIATQPGGAPRNTEITNAADGALVDYDQSAHPGVLRIPCDIGDLWGPGGNTRNSLFRSLPTNWFSLRLTLACAPTIDYQQAHLGIYQDDDNYLDIGIAHNNSLGGRITTFVLETNAVPNHIHIDASGFTNVIYRLDLNPADGSVSSLYSLDGALWNSVGTFTPPFGNPSLILWAGSFNVPYSPGMATADLSQLDVVVSNGVVPALTYQLLNPPPGASIDANGVITWTPAEGQGPGTYVITTLVSDNGQPPLTALNSFNVVVNEVNLPPVLTLPPDANISPLVPWTAQATATDPDIPPEPLTFALVSGPAELTVAPDGTIAWTPGAADAGSTNQVVISVTDTNPAAVNATSLSATGSFQIVVAPWSSPVLTVSADNQTRSYGATNPVLTGTLVGVQNGDTITASFTTPALPASPVGLYPITPVLNDPAGELTNYVVVINNGTLTVNPAPLVVTAQGFSRVYDGTPTATVLLSDDRFSGDSLVTSYVAAEFSDKNIGSNKVVLVSGITLSGLAASNYFLVSTSVTTTASIVPRPLTVVAVPDSKTYDGTAVSLATPTNLDGTIAAGDTANFWQTFDSPDVGTGKTLIPAGSVVDGNSGTNYSLTFSNSTSGSILPLNLVGSIGVADKTYDGTTPASITNWALSGAIAGDQVIYVGGAAYFADPNAGTGKVVTATGLSLAGTNAGNYTVNSNATTTAAIFPARLTVTADNQSRAVGTNNPPLTVEYSGFVNEEDPSVLAGSPSVSTTAVVDSPPGTYPITVTLGSLSATNYTFGFVDGTLTVLPVNGLLITGLSLSNGVATLSWESQAGLTYRLQYNADLGTTNWQDVAPDVVATGATTTATDNSGLTAGRFYRILLLH